MPFKPPCEVMVQAFLPALRSEIVRQLVNVHGIKQTEVAEKLGITQSAVSQYVTRTRGKSPDLLENNPEIKEFVEQVARDVASGKIDGKDISMCGPCKFLKEGDEEENCIGA